VPLAGGLPDVPPAYEESVEPLPEVPPVPLSATQSLAGKAE
jgi:hypothetical protein